MQYSASPFPAVDAALKGADIKVVFVSRSHAHYVLWSFDPVIRALADAVRHPISLTTRGGTQEVALRIALDAAGIARDDLSLKATPFERERLASIRNGGEKMAVLIAGEDAGAGGRRLADLSRDAQLATEGLATNGSELAAHRDRAKRVLYAVRRGASWMVANRDAATSSLRRQMPDDSAYDLAREIAAAIGERNDDGVIARDKIAREIKVRAEMLGVTAPAPEKIYDFSLIAEIKSEGRW